MSASGASRPRASDRVAANKSGPAAIEQCGARERLEAALARVADPAGEGARACLTVYAQPARVAADAADARASAGLALGPLDGAIVSIKDLFDVAGEPTRAARRFWRRRRRPSAMRR